MMTMTIIQIAVALAPLILGSATGLATASGVKSAWYASLKKPTWMPPGAAFGPVWTVLYVLMGLAASRIYGKVGFGVSMVLFWVQLALNIAWSFLFFTKKSLRWALVDIVALWIVLAATVASFSRVDPLAAGLMMPYFAWTTFATALTAALYANNLHK